MSTMKQEALATILKAKGWSIRAAALQTGVNWSHLARVITGERHSRRLIAKIHALPVKPEAR